jgi:hypothetical protein
MAAKRKPFVQAGTNDSHAPLSVLRSASLSRFRLCRLPTPFVWAESSFGDRFPAFREVPLDRDEQLIL